MSQAYKVVQQFEERVAEHYGARYGVATDCCTHAIFLSLKYWQTMSTRPLVPMVMPKKTYISAAFAVEMAGYELDFHDIDWVDRGSYQIGNSPVWDGAISWRSTPHTGLHHPRWSSWAMVCVSFHGKKHIPIGRGGMILTNNEEAADWLRIARYDGRRGLPWPDEKVYTRGYHMYMTPEQAARGLYLMDLFPRGKEIVREDYPDISLQPVFDKYRKDPENELHR